MISGVRPKARVTVYEQSDGVLHMKPVGILGGIVPQTTVFVMQKLLTATRAEEPARHIPLIFNHKPQIPPRVCLVEGEDDREPIPALMSMAQDLERAGAQALAMPNIEAHHYSLALSHATSLPFLDMVKLSATALQGKGIKSVGLLAAPACRSFEVFDTIFETAGLSAIWQKDDRTAALIADAISGADDKNLVHRMEVEAYRLLDLGADHILVANTELSPMSPSLPQDIPFTDSLDCLCDEIVAFATA